MRRFILRLGIAFLTFIVGLGVFAVWDSLRTTDTCGEMTLRFIPETTVIRVDEYPTAKLFITNQSTRTVTLVTPGDGSAGAWRTPVVQWSILEAGSSTEHPTSPNFEPQMRSCGNVNPLRWDEVFSLAPGETKEINRSMPSFRKPGSYRVRYLYANRPSIKWLGLPLGDHNPFAMWRVKNSTECTLISNEVLVTVHD